MHAVRADQHVAGRGLSIGEANCRAFRILLEANARVTWFDRVWIGLTHCLQQHGMKIAAMHHPVWCAEALHRSLTEVERSPTLACTPQPKLAAQWDANNPLHCVAQAEGDQQA